jgi:hypothetical protein
MLVLLPAVLFSSVVAARNLFPRQNSTAQAPAVFAQFPQYGPSTGAGIAGVLEFKNVNGNVEIISSGDSALHNFPAGLGPFLYHGTTVFRYMILIVVHVNPIPSNGSCDAAGAHFDPDNVGETIPCNPATPSECQVHPPTLYLNWTKLPCVVWRFIWQIWQNRGRSIYYRSN